MVLLGPTLLGAGNAFLQRGASVLHALLATLDGAGIEPPIQRPAVYENELLCGHEVSMPKGCNTQPRLASGAKDRPDEMF